MDKNMLERIREASRRVNEDDPSSDDQITLTEPIQQDELVSGRIKLSPTVWG